MDLHEHRWIPREAVAASLVVAHGYGEHGARYETLARPLNDRGIAVYACDHRGHGRSSGPPGIIRRFEDLVDDFATYVATLELRNADAPVFLLGHSLGALIVGHYVLQHRPRLGGLVFSSGVLRIGADVSPTLQRLSWVLNLLVPWLPAVPIRPELTSRIPESVARYANDPLIIHRPMRVGTGYQILRATRAFQEQWGAITDPVLILHGTADRLTDPEGSLHFHERAGAPDKTILLYDGAYHEMLHDLNGVEYVDAIRDWIVSRIG